MSMVVGEIKDETILKHNRGFAWYSTVALFRLPQAGV
jgi:hypothetical protein